MSLNQSELEEEIQIGHKKQKNRDPNLVSISMEQWMDCQEKIATLILQVNQLSVKATEWTSCDPMKQLETLHLQCASHPLDPKAISFTIDYKHWRQFLAGQEVLKKELSHLSLRCQKLEALIQDRLSPPMPISVIPVVRSEDAASRHSANASQITNGPTPASGPSQPLPALPTSTAASLPLTTVASSLAPESLPLTNYVVTAPQEQREANAWTTKTSKRQQKKIVATSPSPKPNRILPPQQQPQLLSPDRSVGPKQHSPQLPVGAPDVQARSEEKQQFPRPPNRPQVETLPAGQRTSGGTTSPLSPSRLRFREKIAALSSREEILNSLQLPPNTAPRQNQIRSVSRIYIKCQLTKSARRDAPFALQQLFRAYTHVKPLGYSLVSNSTAEIFLPEDQTEQAIECLPEDMILWNPVLSYKDVNRRAASYNRAYFPELRWASLDALSNQLQLEVLDKAEASVPRLPEGRRKAVLAAIRQDREWVLAQ